MPELGSLGRTTRMTKPPSNHSVDTTQIVPKGYWTFWFVLSLLGCIGALAMAVYWWSEGQRIMGVAVGVSCLFSEVAWAIIYWRLRNAR